MKYSAFLILLLGLSTFAQNRAPAKAIKRSQLEKTVQFLASDDLKGRKIGSKGIEKAAQYIEGSFEKAGLKPYYKTYRDSFDYKDKTGYNLIAYKEGSDPALKDEVVMLGAHYDHLGILEPVDGDSIANGANDDASGTAAVLALADYFADKAPKRSMLFVLFSGEEEGLIGSTHLAKRLKREETPLYVMLNYEMIGVPQKDEEYLAYLTGYKLSDLAEKFNGYAGQKVLGFLPTAQQNNLFKRSDNYAFYKELGIPSQTLSTFDFQNFDQYHKVGDEVDLVDFPAMKKLVNATIPGIKGIVNSESKSIKIKDD